MHKLIRSQPSLCSSAIRIAMVLLLVSGLSHDSTGTAPPEGLLEKALAEFEKANYPEAIAYLQQALAESPDNAEIYYYLGYFWHYLSYDSVPLTGYGRDKSDEILEHLQKAVELDPHLGNARYFLGAEYGLRARQAMRDGNAAEAVAQFRKGKLAGGYPEWLLEYGRNKLRSCDPDAILFVNGDAETNAIEYLQCVGKYRTDITVIPLALLEQPWSVKMIKDGLPGCLAPAPVSWSDQQISEMHPFKWKQNTVRIPIPENVRQSMNTEQHTFEWVLGPDLSDGEELKYLSAGRAAFADILITNQWQRPIYFSLGCPILEGLEPYIQTCSFVRRLLPYDSDTGIDLELTESLVLDKNSYSLLHTLCDTDMPRVSHLLQNYRSLFLMLTYRYAQSGEMEKAESVFTSMKSNLPEDILPIPENYQNNIERFEQMFKQGR